MGAFFGAFFGCVKGSADSVIEVIFYDSACQSDNLPPVNPKDRINEDSELDKDEL